MSPSCLFKRLSTRVLCSSLMFCSISLYAEPEPSPAPGGVREVPPFTPAMPLPVLKAAHVAQDFVPDGKLAPEKWQTAVPGRIEHDSETGKPYPALSSTVRALWSTEFLYLGYECPYEKITVFDPPKSEERIGLWDRDVVEAFIGTDAAKADHYTEYEWAPNGEKLDLLLDLPKRDFGWSSGMESAVSIDDAKHVWRVEVRIPMKALASEAPKPGTRWRIDLFRRDTAGKAYLAFSPTFTDTYHTPARFGWLELLP